MRYSYFHATPAELFAHVAKSSRSSVSAAKKYYSERGHFEVAAQIDSARIAMRINRLVAKQQAQQYHN